MIRSAKESMFQCYKSIQTELEVMALRGSVELHIGPRVQPLRPVPAKAMPSKKQAVDEPETPMLLDAKALKKADEPETPVLTQKKANDLEKDEKVDMSENARYF